MRSRFSSILLALTLVFVVTASPRSVAQEGRRLPTVDTSNEATEQESDDGDESADEDEYVSPVTIVKEAFEAPPGARSLSDRHVWIDRKKGWLFVDGYVAMTRGFLEMFACPIGTKEHEPVIASLAKASELHAGLLALGAKAGTPVQRVPKFVPATGQRIRVWICYYDEQDKFQAIDARSWVRNSMTEKQLKYDWVFSGSGFWKDESDGREYYRANGGDMICVSNFNTAMMDLPVASSAEADSLVYRPFTERIPPRGTPVRLVMTPIPVATDDPQDQAKDTSKVAPTADVLPRKKSGDENRS